MNTLEKDLRKKVNDLVSTALNFLRNGEIYNVAPFIIIIFDKNTGELIDANNLFLNYLGYELEDIKHKSFFDLLDPKDLKRTQDNYKEFQENPEGHNIFLNHYKSKNGTYKPIYWIKSVNADKAIGEYSFGFGLPKVDLYD